ncbi:Uncharacterised protein [Candidatus Bilamarchaeum dharawalense]|uniref:DUF4349 domain-containing protein n=1 Tax=Candidatus Bilamarchaeum dharawalense TaxID=2885759 RepID=A0A5E4LSD7_9ARCH|nr:Uncharacterised protein [Candidatus Bilamarchaeum dharawalense]
MIHLRKFVILSLLLLLLTFGCLGGNGSYGSSDIYPVSDSYQTKESALSPAYSLGGTTNSVTYVTKEGSMSVKVPEGTLETKFTELKNKLVDEGATFSDIRYNEYSDKKQYTLTLKVLPAKFESINSLIKETGEVKDMSVQLEDVTQQYTDLQTRITNKQIELERLRALYNQSSKVSDLLSVEHELTRVETEYDLLLQQKIYLDSRIQKSTIYLTVYEDKPATQQLIIPFEGLGNLFFGAMAAAIAIIVAVIGFIIPVSIVVLVLWFIYKKIKGNKVQTSKVR